MTNVADKLRTPAKKWPWIVGVPAVVLLAGGAWLGAAAFAQPAPTPTPAPTDYVATLTAAEQDSVQQAADAQQAKIVADAAAAQAAADAEAAAAADAASQSSSSGWAPGQAPAGTPIPLHLDTDPNSGSYGQMMIENPDQFCASNGGTTGPGGVAVCS